jgi:hypothetical protein
MSTSYSVSESTSFTVTHARHMAAKVATDLKRMQRLYGSPSDTDIADYETEAIELLKAGYLNTVWYGYRRDEKWVEPTLRYTAKDLAGASANDDDPGRIRLGADITGANFYSYLTRSSAWHNLSSEQRQTFEKGLPFQRGGAPEPSVNGYLSPDRTYSAGGQALNRDSVRSW